jgi:hypothetical protein
MLLGLLLSGCASVDRCPLSGTQKGLGACASIEDSYNASNHSQGDGFSVFSKEGVISNNKDSDYFGDSAAFDDQSDQTTGDLYFSSTAYSSSTSSTPSATTASKSYRSGDHQNQSDYVYHSAIILKTWIAPYVNESNDDLVNAHEVFWKAKKGGWDVPVSYQSGKDSEVFSPAVLGG